MTKLPADAAAAVRAATTILAEAGVPSPRVDAEILAAFAAGLDRAEFNRQAVLGRPTPSGYADLIVQRAQRIPLQHLTGTAHFLGLELKVGPGVFVPRPETELIATDAIAAAKAAGRRPRVVDMGTGSGAIALAIATAVRRASVWAVELDQDAYTWAARNLASTHNVRLVRGDARTALTALNGLVDVVVSNPPYIPPWATPVDVEVRDHDPDVALYGLGVDGLAMPRGFLLAAARLLRPGGVVFMEHADTQGEAVRAMARTHFTKIATRPDLTGRDRYLTGVRL